MHSLADIKQYFANDIATNNQVIIDQLASDVTLINQISHHIINSGGKRLRPLLVMMVANAVDYQHMDHYRAAAVIEFIHTATLLHDDVVDDSHLRRGKATANAEFGNPASVLTGDFLYSRAFQIMVALNDMAIMEVLANATNKISEGEVLQLLHSHQPDLSTDDYLNIIYCKTAKLFEAACEVGVILKSPDHQMRQPLKQYGMHLGNAFQIADDVLDYTADADTMGKNVGDDLAEGKVTLPLILAQQTATPEQIQIIQSALQQGHTDEIENVISILHQTNALEQSYQWALGEAEKASACLKVLPDSPAKQALELLPKLAVSRQA